MRGLSHPRSTIQIVRTFGVLPPGVSIRPSRTYLIPCVVATRDFRCGGEFAEGFGQHEPVVRVEAERHKERRFARVVGMRRIQQVIRDLLSLDRGLFGVGQLHLDWRSSGTKVSALLNLNPSADR